MGLFYKVSPKQLLEIRNEIFVKNGVPALERNGFQKSPFAVDWFGRNNLGDYTYVLYRLSAQGHLETVTTHICRGDLWIQIYLNVFEVRPMLKSLEQLIPIEGLQYHLPPNTLTRMRLRSDDFKGIPLFNTVHHKISTFFTKGGYQRSIRQLSKLIENDLININHSINKWHKLHKPLITTWDGKIWVGQTNELNS